jgi:hypothetical protein
MTTTLPSSWATAFDRRSRWNEIGQTMVIVVGMDRREFPGARKEAPYNTEADLAVGLAASSRRKRGD